MECDVAVAAPFDVSVLQAQSPTRPQLAPRSQQDRNRPSFRHRLTECLQLVDYVPDPLIVEDPEMGITDFRDRIAGDVALAGADRPFRRALPLRLGWEWIISIQCSTYSAKPKVRGASDSTSTRRCATTTSGDSHAPKAILFCTPDNQVRA